MIAVMNQSTLWEILKIPKSELYKKFQIDNTYLSTPVAVISQFDLWEGDAVFHPVLPKVGRLGMKVNCIQWRLFRLSSGYPLAIDVFPSEINTFSRWYYSWGCDFQIS